MLYFRCARTALLYPSDYIEQWGKRYGVGLGPEPVSEALVNNYHLPIVDNHDAMLTMHPVSLCRAQVDLIDVVDGDPQLQHMAVLALDDPTMTERAAIMRTRQRVHDPKMARIEIEENAFRARSVSSVTESVPGPGKTTTKRS